MSKKKGFTRKKFVLLTLPLFAVMIVSFIGAFMSVAGQVVNNIPARHVTEKMVLFWLSTKGLEQSDLLALQFWGIVMVAFFVTVTLYVWFSYKRMKHIDGGTTSIKTFATIFVPLLPALFFSRVIFFGYFLIVYGFLAFKKPKELPVAES